MRLSVFIPRYQLFLTLLNIQVGVFAAFRLPPFDERLVADLVSQSLRLRDLLPKRGEVRLLQSKEEYRPFLRKMDPEGE